MEGRSVINELDDASFECIADANPSSDLTIKNPDGFKIFKVSNSNIARYTLRNATYFHAGEYTCSGRNNYTRGLPSSSILVLIVKCKSSIVIVLILFVKYATFEQNIPVIRLA